MADSRLRLRLGVFVAAALTALAGLVILFGGTPGVFSSKAKYVVIYPEAPGVAVGTPVRKSGVRIGEVTALDLDENTGHVRASIAVDKKHLPRTGEDATISRGILNGDTSIDFLPRLDPDNPQAVLPRGEPIPPGSEIKGIAPVTARSLIGQAQAVLPSAQESLGQIVGTARRLEQAVPKIEKAADEFAGLARSGRDLVPELRQTNARVQDLLGQPDPLRDPATVQAMLRELIELMKTIKPAAEEIRALIKQNGPELNRTLVSVRQAADSTNDVLNPDNRKAVAATLKNLQAGSDDLTKTIRLVAILTDSADRTLKSMTARLDQSEKTFDNLNRITTPLAGNSDQIAKDVSELARNLNALSAQLGGGQGGSFGKILSDPSLYHNLNDSAANAARVLARLEKVAQDLQVFSDKIARKPEVLGAGGVVRPSTGLKESPTAPLPPSAPLPIAPTTGGPLPPAVTPFPPVSSFKPGLGNDLPPPRREN